MIDGFLQRKEDILNKIDKSSVGRWDSRIIPLCRKINSFGNYYTTSSCSGRIVLMIDKQKKQSDLFLSKYHSQVNFDKLTGDLDRLVKKNKAKSLVKFKQEPPILHVHCKTFEDAKKLLRRAQLAGWKKSGIISSGKRIILEINGTEKLEFPIIKNKKLLVDDEFLEIIIEKSNKNLEKGWMKIDRLKKSL